MINWPVRLFLRLFRWFCDPDIVEDIEGDLLERMEIRSRKKSIGKARWLLIRDVVALFRPGIIRNFRISQKLNTYDMFINHLKAASRTLLKQKVYSSIKIGGFAIGISICLLIALFMKDELSYNSHLKDHDELYMAVIGYRNDGDLEKYTWFPAPYAGVLKSDFPEVTESGRMLVGQSFGAGDANIRIVGETVNYFETGFAYADQSVLDIFGWPMVHGNPETALEEPWSMILTERKAEKLFPGINPIGKTVYIDNYTENAWKITGVLKDLPENSTIKFDYLWSLKGRELWPNEQSNW